MDINFKRIYVETDKGYVFKDDQINTEFAYDSFREFTMFTEDINYFYMDLKMK